LRKPKLLISVWYPERSTTCIRGGADIIDVKNPSRGSLGAPSFKVVKEIVERFRGIRELSAAVGDITCCPEMTALAAYALSKLGLNYVKIGLQVDNERDGLEIVREVVETVGSLSKVIVVGYADYERAKALSPLKVVEVAYRGDAHGVMIDTRIKDGLTSLDILPMSYIREFVGKARETNLLKAFAGGLRKEHLVKILNLGFDVIGFRTAACENGRLGKVSERKVRELKQVIERFQSCSPGSGTLG